MLDEETKMVCSEEMRKAGETFAYPAVFIVYSFTISTTILLGFGTIK
jgi:hypothetical protein